jgi:hypothetical protein
MSHRECAVKCNLTELTTCFGYSPRRPQRDLIHPCPVQSLPPLRAFLRNKGINADIDARRPQLVGTAHEAAREEARRRALKAPATRCVFFGPLTPLVSLVCPYRLQ